MTRTATIVALLTTLAACKNHPSKLDVLPGTSPVGVTSNADGSGSPDTSVDAPPARDPLTVATLMPIIHELGPDGVVPTSIVIQLAKPVIDKGDVGNSTVKTKLEITPDVPGRLTYTGVSELTFIPNGPFNVNTAYAVRLKTVETRDGVLEAPAHDPAWGIDFKTPDFAFLEWAPSELDVVKHTAVMDIAFSAPLLSNVAAKSMTFTIDGAPASAIQVMPSHEPNVVRVKLSDARIKIGTKLGLVIKAGIATIAGGMQARGRTAELTISADETVSIKDVTVVEGGSGFYVEVICNDAAAHPGNRSYYGSGASYYDLSQRCMLPDASHITFTPAVKNVYVTSGRAGFRVFGDFKRGVYKMKIAGGATSVDGGVLLAAYSGSFSVAARKPQLSFAANGRYLPRTAWNNLGIKHLNVDAVNLVVRQIPPENLVFWLGNDSGETADERTSNVIFKKELPLRGTADAADTAWLDVQSMLPQTTKGVLELRLVGVGATATSRLLLTNMSLVAKKTSTPDKPWEQHVQVWALDMDTNALLDDVEVSLVRKSGKTVARCTTSGASGCAMASRADDIDEAEPFALIARRGDDLTYIRYKDLRADVVESSTSGVPYAGVTPYRASVFTERGVYRPGETAHVVAIVRDQKDKAPDAGLPVEVKLVDPRAKVARKLTLKTNAAGVIAFDHALPAFADTGHWRVTLTVANKPLGTDDFQVEEFVPERMKVAIAPKQPDVLAGSPVGFDINARYLFGGSAVDSGVTLNCSIAPSRFVPEQNSDLTYGVEPKGKAVTLGETRDQLDPKGQVAMTCAQPEENTAFTQTGELTATASVLEAGSGRATVKTATVTVHPEKYYIGLKSKATKAVAGDTFQVEGMIVDWNGKPVVDAVKQLDIELVDLDADYSYGYDDDTGESRYDRWLREVPDGKKVVGVSNGRFTFDVTPGNAQGGYVVRVKAGHAKTELVLDGDYSYDYYGYGEDERADQTPRPARPTQLKLDLPKEIKVGDAVSVKAKAPYHGKILWTVETDHVLRSEWQNVSGAEAAWSFKIDHFAPNVYVTAFLVKDPHAESKDAFMPDRAYGVQSTKVTPVDLMQNVKIDVPASIRSSSPLNVKLDLGGAAANTFAVVAVVDEGILSLTGFKTPDPLSELLLKRALGVETYETIGWTMLHQPAGASTKTGGGDDEGGEDSGDTGGDRVQPIKPVALWSGVLPIGADGKLTVPFSIPTYRGELRVMAFTAGPSRVGRAEAKVTVKDPLVIQVTFPRFVTQNDKMEIPVFMTNMSGGPLDISVQLASSDATALQFGGKDTGTLHLDDGRADTLVFQTTAKLPIGASKLRVVAKATGRGGAFEVSDDVDVPFLPAGPTERVVQKIKLVPGTLDLAAQPALKGWVPATEKATFWMTSNPFGEVFDHLDYLVHYPYGCIEQTTSATRPLLYIANLVEQVDPDVAQMKIEDMVLAGINRVLSMETPSGGFGYWPGSDRPEDWGTAYAMHMLLDAKKAGYAVPEDRLQGVLTWMEGRVAELEARPWETQRSYWYQEQGETYLHYVLALAGKGKKARILKLIERLPKNAKQEQAEDLYMLKAALYLAGDRRYADELKHPDTSPIENDRSNSWSFYSDRRRRGMMLSTFFDLFGADPAGELLATRVAEGVTGERSYWYTTQELVWAVTGLGKWVNATTKGVAAGVLTADGANIDARKTKKPTNDKTWFVPRASDKKSLVLDVPASSAGMYLVISTQGVRAGADYKVGGNGMRVTRTYRNLDGEVLDLSQGTVKLGDLVYVEDELTNTSALTIQNIALVDRLPAGFEIENARLGRNVQADWINPDDQWATDFSNLRDDRLEAFGSLLPRTSKKIIYTVRAVTSGSYATPPIDAEAMYDPTLWAREKGSTAVVGGPWTGKTL